MQLKKIFLVFQFLFALCALSSCSSRSSYDMWEDTKTCGRHINRGFRSLYGDNEDSRAVCCRDHFYGNGMEFSDSPGEDFIPLVDESGSASFPLSDRMTAPPRETPGEFGSTIPGIQAFCDPSTQANLAGVFVNIYFEYDSNLIRDQQSLENAKRISNYLISHPNTYIFVEGHCDERGPEAYNLALGSRRANAVRNLLIQNGAHPDHIFTISYGREHPLVLEHHEEAWAQNRRAEFKVYQR